jgi:tRNA nucleotidyltransferase (CCA-adding enzyme)
MGYIDDAFSKLKHNLKITTTEQNLASTHHITIRDYVREHWKLADDFLTGSYRRDTKTKKLKDVDVFVVIDADEPQSRYSGPYRGAQRAGDAAARPVELRLPRRYGHRHSLRER